jgi:HYDIN/CFA65/VesB family protein
MVVLSRVNRSNRLLVWVALLSPSVLAISALSIRGLSTPNHVIPLSLSSHSASTASQHFPLEISPDLISLGVLDAGQSARVKLALRNPGRYTAVLERIETSRPCLQINPSTMRVEPGESGSLVVTFDTPHDSDFRGSLSVDVIGHSSLGKALF